MLDRKVISFSKYKMCVNEMCKVCFRVVRWCKYADRSITYHKICKNISFSLRVAVTCYSCLGYPIRPVRTAFVKQAMIAGIRIFEDPHKFDVLGICDFCGGFEYITEKCREDFSNIWEIPSQEKFLFCKYTRCSDLFQKYLMHNPIKTCLITPYVVKKRMRAALEPSGFSKTKFRELE
jgi:hypothetical protein